jgi:DNA-binding CsgD family transcriptional regulator
MPGVSAASTTGNPGDTLIVTVSGRVKVVVHSVDGGELTLTVIRPGGRRCLARQAEQIPSGRPGWIVRNLPGILTDALIEAGDLAAAEGVRAAGLAQSRDAGGPGSQAHLLTQIATLDEQAGITGFTAPPAEARRRHESPRKARQALGPAETRADEEPGAAMSMAIAAEHALMPTTPEPQPPTAAPGARKLSAREQELVALVAQGRTNAQIAAQLYISVRTVGSHLDRIRDKTGCRRRADLTHLGLTAGLV